VKLVRFVTLRRDTARFSICVNLRNLRMKIYPQMDADLRRLRLQDDNGGDACWSEP
jgi:hypothetical protein